MAWDSSFKNILRKYLVGGTVITEMEVPQANLRLDFLIEHTGRLQYPFNWGRKHLLGEFKSERDRFNVHELHRSIAKAYLYSASERVDIREISLCFVVSRSIPKSLTDIYGITELQQGIYKVEHDLDLQIILLNEIDYDSGNSYLGIFARKSIRREIIKRALTEGERFIISIAYFLYKEEVIEVTEAENIDVDPISLSIKSAVESIGLDRVINEIGIERVINEIGIERVINEIGIEKLFEKLSDEQRKKVLKILTKKEE